MCLVGGLLDANATFLVLHYGPGFTAMISGARGTRILLSIRPPKLPCRIVYRQGLTYEVSLEVCAETHAASYRKRPINEAILVVYVETYVALYFMVTQLQARAVDNAPKCGTSLRDE